MIEAVIQYMQHCIGTCNTLKVFDKLFSSL